MSTLNTYNLKSPDSASTNLALDASGNVAIQTGSASAPSIYVTGDANTGIYSPGGDQVALTTGGSARLYISSSGQVGIGTTSPDQALTVQGVLAIRDSSGAGVGQLGSIGSTFRIQGQTGANLPLTLWTSDSERARIDTSGRLLVGTSTAPSAGDGQFDLAVVQGNTTGPTGHGSISIQRGEAATSITSGEDIGYIKFNDSSGNSFAQIRCTADANAGSGDYPGRLVFSTTADGASSPTERMRISSTGLVDIPGGTSGSYSGQQPLLFGVYNNSSSGQCLAHIQGHNGNSSGANTYALRISQNVDANGETSAALRIDNANPAGGTGGALIQAFSNISNSTTQRIWQVNSVGGQLINRPASDGTLIDFQQAQTSEGSISVSGTTVSYNGAHLSRWSQLPGGAERTEILRGTVLKNIDEMCAWGEEDNEQLNRTQVSDVEGDPNVAGVFQCWDDDDDTYTDDFYCAMTGDFIIRISAGIPVHRGQLLMSAGDGTAKPQDDDIVRSKTIAKVTSNHITCTYDDGSYCVPCVLLAC
jgi:hypothetical protein